MSFLFCIKAVSKMSHFFGCSCKNYKEFVVLLSTVLCSRRVASPSPCSAADVHARGSQGSGEGRIK